MFPEAKYQRCTVRFYRNVFSVTTRSKAKLVARMLKAIHAQESKKAAREKAKAVVEELRFMKLEEAAKADQQNDWNCRWVLSQKYAVICTNPPYLNKYNDKLKKFVTESYKDLSGDLFSVFIYRNFRFCKRGLLSLHDSICMDVY